MSNLLNEQQNRKSLFHRFLISRTNQMIRNSRKFNSTKMFTRKIRL